MYRRGPSTENKQPALPSFRPPTGTSKTYRKKPREGKVAEAQSSIKKKGRRSFSEEETVPMWKKPLETKRCALQTLCERAGGPMSSTKAILRKMKPYGGTMFYDKCYLSGDEQVSDEVDEMDERSSWALSPSDMAEVSRTAPRATIKKKEDKTVSSSSSSRPTDGRKKRKAAAERNAFSMLFGEDDVSSYECGDSISASKEFRSTEEDAPTKKSVKKVLMKKESPERLFTRKKSDKDGATKIGHAKRIPIKGVESVGLRQATGLPNHNRSTAKTKLRSGPARSSISRGETFPSTSNKRRLQGGSDTSEDSV